MQSSKSKTSIDQDISFFCFPIVVELEQIENIINKKIPSVLSWNITTKHNIRLDIQRAGPIRLDGLNNKLLTYILVKVKARRGKLRSKLKTEFTIELCIYSALDFSTNWDVLSRSSLENVTWLEAPIISILGLELDIKPIVQREIEKNEEVLISKVDNAIHKKVSIKPQLEKTWVNLQKPHNLIKKESESLYLHIEPQEINYLNHEIVNKEVNLNPLISSFFSIHSKSKSKAEDASPLPNLQKSSQNCEGFDLNVIVSISLDSLNKSINRLLNEDQTLNIQGYEVLPTSASIQASGSSIMIDVSLEGTVNGILRELCDLNLDTQSQKLDIILKQTEVISGDMELEFAHLIFGGFINDYLQDFSGFQLDSSLNKIPELIQRGLARGKSADKWHPEINKMNTKLMKIDITSKEILIKASCTGDIEIVIDKLQS